METENREMENGWKEKVGDEWKLETKWSYGNMKVELENEVRLIIWIYGKWAKCGTNWAWVRWNLMQIVGLIWCVTGVWYVTKRWKMEKKGWLKEDGGKGS